MPMRGTTEIESFYPLLIFTSSLYATLDDFLIAEHPALFTMQTTSVLFGVMRNYQDTVGA